MLFVGRLGWRPSLLGWRSSLLGWRPSLFGWRPCEHEVLLALEGHISLTAIHNTERSSEELFADRCHAELRLEHFVGQGWEFDLWMAPGPVGCLKSLKRKRFPAQMIYVWKCLPDPGLQFIKAGHFGHAANSFLAKLLGCTLPASKPRQILLPHAPNSLDKPLGL